MGSVIPLYAPKNQNQTQENPTVERVGSGIVKNFNEQFPRSQERPRDAFDRTGDGRILPCGELR